MEKSKNKLAQEKSPYLLQHADNPVNWFPWGEEAFRLAREQDKPVFLSIGYSTCHWCHVMAHESFENQHIADLLNQWFICIKVDREERPDVDQTYMAATQAMTGSGGWPMSVFLFPDGRPFYAATYIPPASMYGKPGLPDLLAIIHKAWQEKRDDLHRTAESLIDALQKEQKNDSSAIRDDVTTRALSSLQKSFDSTYGGFGQAPKFPRPVVFHFLLRQYSYMGSKKALEITLSTLDAMARGGMYDHLGGGFHRYSVDGQWRVPHFEKMLYDQAQLARMYVDAFMISGKKRYANLAGGIFDYVLREMRDTGGGFYSAEDADSADPYDTKKHSEGAYYLWTEKDIVSTLGAKRANIFSFCYGVEFDGNALNDPQNEFTGRNILFLKNTPQEAAEKFALDRDEIEKVLSESRKILLEKRTKRIRPHCDDKVLTSWNGLMIGALARGGIVLGRKDYLQAANEAAGFIRQNLYNAGTGELTRRYRDGEAGHAGQLDDYAFLVAGLLDLYQAVHDPALLTWAINLTQKQINLFRDPANGGFFDSVEDERLPFRMKGDYDGAEPAGNSVAAMNLLWLGRINGNNEWIELARHTVDSFASRINDFPEALPAMLCTFMDLQQKPEQVVIAGIRGAEDTETLLKAAAAVFHPGRLILFADGKMNQELLGRNLPFIQSVSMRGNKATAYVCQDFTCNTPVTEAKLLVQLLEKQ